MPDTPRENHVLRDLRAARATSAARAFRGSLAWAVAVAAGRRDAHPHTRLLAWAALHSHRGQRVDQCKVQQLARERAACLRDLRRHLPDGDAA